MIIGIDATNLRGGGGVTHLVELLSALELTEEKFKRIIIWGNSPILDTIKNEEWIIKYAPKTSQKGLFFRMYWQCFCLSNEARKENCDVLFIPGGSYVGNFHPIVTMSQNLLPFELCELKRYGFCLFTLKLLLLRFIQSNSFRRSDGIIFLTRYAQSVVTNVVGFMRGKVGVIPHGINMSFDRPPKKQFIIDRYKLSKPYRVLYVSTIDQYKHQWNVVHAISRLRHLGLPIVLDLIGSSYSPALERLKRTIATKDHHRRWVNYLGEIPFDKLSKHYAEADLGIFASSCENMPNILLEMMASGLPIACSNRGPMPEILGEPGVYFNPENVESIFKALYGLIESPELRKNLSKEGYAKSKFYSWNKCATETIDFISSVVKDYKKAQLCLKKK